MTIYKKKNAEGTIKLFDSRIVYDDRLNKATSPKSAITDFTFGEKLLYGRVDRSFVPIGILDESSLRPIRRATNPDNVRVLNFVADAFNALSLQFEKKKLANEISPKDPYLSSLRVFKGYKSIDTLYESYRRVHFQVISKEIKKQNPQIMNFRDFEKTFSNVLRHSAETIPLTKAAFAKSRRCPMNASGLVIEIADLSSSNDDDKVTKFVNSPNWEFYLNACAAYGFMVDKHQPWRLVADIGSPQMQQFAAAYDQSKTDLVLWTSYEPLRTNSYETFVSDIQALYRLSTKGSVRFTSECRGKTITTYKAPAKYSAESLEKHFSEQNMLKMYYNLRLWEEENNLSETERKSLLTDSMQVYYNKGVTSSLFIFEKIVNKPFDKSGSLSYIVKKARARAEES